MALYNKPEDLTKCSLTELLTMINNSKENHDRLKQEIINHTYEVEELEKVINQKLAALDEVEKTYVDLIEEITKREKINKENGI